MIKSKSLILIFSVFVFITELFDKEILNTDKE